MQGTTPTEPMLRRKDSENSPASTSLFKSFHNSGLHKNQYTSQSFIINSSFKYVSIPGIAVDLRPNTLCGTPESQEKIPKLQFIPNNTNHPCHLLKCTSQMRLYGKRCLFPVNLSIRDLICNWRNITLNLKFPLPHSIKVQAPLV